MENVEMDTILGGGAFNFQDPEQTIIYTPSLSLHSPKS